MSAEPQTHTGELDHGEENFGQLVEGSNPAECFNS